MLVLRNIVASAAFGCALAGNVHADAPFAQHRLSIAQVCSDTIFSIGFEAPTRRCSKDGTTMIFIDRTEFLEALEVGHIENNFNDIPPGPSGELHFDENGFEYRIVTQRGSDGLLFNGDGFLSTERSADSLQLFIEPFVRPINAIGADFFTTDFQVAPAAGTLRIALFGDAVELTLESTGAPVFRGFISDVNFGGWDEFASGGTQNGTPADRWPAMDNILLGQHR